MPPEETNACNELVYLTGMSLDKKRLNSIISGIDNDADFSYWIDEANKSAKKAYEGISYRLAAAWESAQRERDGTVVMGVQVFTKIADHLLSFSGATAVLKYILALLAKKTIYVRFAEQYPVFHQIFTNLNNSFEFIQYKPRDFFSVYLAHQSDAYTAPAFANLLGRKKQKFTWVYSDRNWYDNKFIDHVTIKVNKKFISKDQAEEIFKCHATEIILSRAIGEINLSRNNTIKSTFMSFFENSRSADVQDVTKSLAERNLFGIGLLSQVIYFIRTHGATKGHQFTIKPSHLGNDLNAQNQRAFLQEIITCSDDPTAAYNSNNPDFEIIEASLSYSAKPGGGDFFVEEGDYLLIRVPVKILMSLPIAEFVSVNAGLELLVSADITIPKAADQNDQQKILLTVGGAEHNRALAHLINLHRKQQGDNRAFGFMDNIFDFSHKIARINNHTGAEEHSFLMGLNQPVSGFNGYFRYRQDDVNNNSSARDAKLLHFELDQNETIPSKYRVIVIYGFSALTSKILSCNVLAEFFKEIDSDNLRPSTLFINKLFRKNSQRRNGAGEYFRYKADAEKIINENFPTLAEILQDQETQSRFIKIFSIFNEDDQNETLIASTDLYSRMREN